MSGQSATARTSTPGAPGLVIATRRCSVSTSSKTSDKCAFASASAGCSAARDRGLSFHFVSVDGTPTAIGSSWPRKWADRQPVKRATKSPLLYVLDGLRAWSPVFEQGDTTSSRWRSALAPQNRALSPFQRRHRRAGVDAALAGVDPRSWISCDPLPEVIHLAFRGQRSMSTNATGPSDRSR